MDAESGVTDAPAKRKLGARGKILAIALVVVVVIAVALGALLWSWHVPDGAAAKVNDTYIQESDVSAYISQYRSSHGFTDNSALASALESQGLTVSGFRINAIDQLAIRSLVEKRAEELGVTPSDDEVQKEVASAKSSVAFNDDATWQKTLQQYGMTEEQVEEQYRASLAQRAVCEKDVARRTPTDAEALSYAKANLAGQTEYHYLRIVFTGDKQSDRAYACLKKLKAAGTMDAKTFEKFAKQYSDDSNAKADGGSYKWTLELDSSSETAQVVGELKVGAMSAVESIQADNATEIFFCDTSYTFPKASGFSKLKASQVPSSLMTAVKSAASDTLWNNDCTAYLAKLLAQAKVTYYPMPDDASYNVDLSSASSSSASSSSAAASSSSSASASDSQSTSSAESN